MTLEDVSNYILIGGGGFVVLKILIYEPIVERRRLKMSRKNTEEMYRRIVEEKIEKGYLPRGHVHADVEGTGERSRNDAGGHPQ